MTELFLGSDIPFEFNLESGETPNTFENLDDLQLLEVEIYTSKDDVKLFSKDVKTGYTLLRKIDEFNYSADLTTDLNKYMATGTPKLRIIWQELDATFADGNYRYEKEFTLNEFCLK